MDQETALAIAKANLACLAHSLGFNDVAVGPCLQTKDGIWHLEGSVYKTNYGVSITTTSAGYTVSVHDLSVTEAVYHVGAK